MNGLNALYPNALTFVFMNQYINIIDLETIADGGNGNIQFSGCVLLYFPGAFPWKQNC
jgi:hypothetical protein